MALATHLCLELSRGEGTNGARCDENGGATRTPSRGDRVASVGYLKTPTGGQRPCLVIKESGEPEAELEYSQETVVIHDARPHLAAGRISLASTGSELIPHETALETADFYSNVEAIRTTYYKEVCRAVQAATGAETVVAIHHQVRNEPKAVELVGGDVNNLPRYKTNAPTVPQVDGYAVNAHVDFSAMTAARTAREQLYRVSAPDRARYVRGRYMLVSAWRNISDRQPIQNNHLAVIDGSTLAPEDIVLVDMQYENFRTECAQVAHTASQRHRWLYYPEMRKEELLLFTQYDSDPKKFAPVAVHCSFTDPLAPVGALPRESIEVRTVAFFPSTSDVAGDAYYGGLLALSAFPPAAEIAQRLCGQLEFPELWPPDMRQWLRDAISQDVYAIDAAETVMNLMVDQNADPENPEVLMAGAPAELRRDVLRALRDSNFQERLRTNFGPPSK